MFAAVIYGASHDLSQDIITAFVTWQNAVRDRERGRARMICYHAAGKLLRIGQSLVITHLDDYITNNVSGQMAFVSVRNLDDLY